LHAQKPPSGQGGGDKPMKVRGGWTPTMELRSSHEGRQVKCLTADEGHVWIHRYDSLPPPVRQRLANGRFNICPACLRIDAQYMARKQRLKRPTVAIYLAAIKIIEQKLDGLGNKQARGPLP
jgi:hypothetical protein